MIVPIIKRIENEVKDEYDLVIIGAGPAGLNAALYAGRFKISTLVISKELGGTLNEADIIENYLGFERITGKELTEKFVNHAKIYDIHFLENYVTNIVKENNYFIVETSSKRIKTKSIILATGERHRKLNLPKEKELTGKGISYCAACDAPLFKDKEVAIVGGGNVAFSDAQILARHAKKIYLIHRRKEFRADPIEVERVKNLKNVEILVPYVVKEIIGEKKLEGIVIEEVDENLNPTGKTINLRIEGLFVAIGMEPNNELAKKLGVSVDENGYIIVDDYMRTNVEGIFAAGDVTNKGSIFRQIILAAAQGSIAAFSVFKYLKSKNLI